MKSLGFITWVLFLFMVLSSCKKNSDSGNPVPVSALTIINAVQGSDPLIADPNGVDSTAAYFATTPQIGFGASQEYSLPSGNTRLTVYDVADTTSPLFQGNISLRNSAIYSLFLSGVYSAQNKPDTLLTLDQIPYYGTDSLSGVRFINLSPGSQPISVNIAGNPGTEMEFSNIGYRQISNFKPYSIVASIGGSYNFEIRDELSDSLLATYSWTYTPQKNSTIVIGGLENNGFNIFQVNNY